MSDLCRFWEYVLSLRDYLMSVLGVGFVGRICDLCRLLEGILSVKDRFMSVLGVGFVAMGSTFVAFGNTLCR